MLVPLQSDNAIRSFQIRNGERPRHPLAMRFDTDAEPLQRLDCLRCHGADIVNPSFQGQAARIGKPRQLAPFGEMVEQHLGEATAVVVARAEK